MQRLLCLIWIAVSSAGVFANGPVGLDAIESFDRICELRQGVRTRQYSSHDPTGANADSAHFLDASGTDHVLLDVKGPGCVYRIWITAMLTGQVRVYLEGSPTPVIDLPRSSFFSGATPPLLAPLVGDSTVSSGGFYCYLPIPFRERCRITTSGTFHYYNVTYHTFADDTGVTPFTGTEDGTAARNLWNTAGTDPKSDPGTTVLTDTISLAPAATAILADISNAGTIQSIELNLPGLAPGAASKALLSGLKLRAFWDGSATPAVDAPVGDFFGSGLGAATVDALPVGMDGTRLYCYFPMPFNSGAMIRLVNNGSTAVNNLTYTVRYTPHPEPRSGVGAFHAVFRAEKPTTLGRDFLALDESGGGHVVGIVHTLVGETSSHNFLEGDERIYLDDSFTPALYGTGTEDIYNGGFYFSQGPFTLPVHGAPAIEEGARAANTCYRFFLSDPIVFTTRIRLGIEHGLTNNDQPDVQSVVFFYKSPAPLATVTDQLDVGDAASETAHAYTATGQTFSGTTADTYEGDDDTVVVSDNGRRLASGSEFTVAIASDNAGVMLRRRMDYGYAYQEANVYVDDVLAGAWYDPGQNTSHRFRDSEFLIPPALTHGKTGIQIRIENMSPASDWTEYRYWVYTLIPVEAATPPVPGDLDGDGDVDLDDYGLFQACYSGPGIAQTNPACAGALLDFDNDVDPLDFEIFTGCLSGAGVPGDPDCAD